MPSTRLKAISGHTTAWHQLLTTRDFGWLWAGQVISQIGDNLTKVALLWFVYQLTGSALKMTVIGVLQTVPPLLLGPITGVYLDRVSKRAAMILIDVVRGGLLILIPIFHALGLLNLMWLYVLVFIVSLFSMAFGPALNAAIPLIAKEDQLTTANAIMQGSVTIGQLLGPAISGILIAIIGAQNVLYVNAATFLISALCKIPLRIRSPNPQGARGSAKTVWRDLREGFRFVFVQHRLLLMLMIMAALFTMGSAGFMFLLPVIGERILRADSVELGWLWSSLGFGLLITTIWLALQDQVDLCRRLWTIAGSALIGGLAVLGLNWTPPMIVVAVLMVAIGGSSGLVTPIVSASLQQMTPKDLLARVFGVFNTGTMAFAMIGMTALGWMADHFSPVVSLVGIGTVKLGTAAITALLNPWCMRLSSRRLSDAPNRG